MTILAILLGATVGFGFVYHGFEIDGLRARLKKLEEK